MHIFLTGANGFLGTVLLRDLLLKGHTVSALVRSKTGQDADSRLKETLLDYDPDFDYDETRRRNLFLVEGNATKDFFGLDQRNFRLHAERSDMILHNVACTALETDWNIYEEVNINGTRKAIEFAAHTSRKQIAYVSTAYVAGSRTGVVMENDLDPGGNFRNSYERSKAIAENEVRVAEKAGKIRAMILRPSIIVGDSNNGWMCKEHHFFDFIHRLLWILKLIYRRAGTDYTSPEFRFRIPANSQTTKNFISVDHVAKLIAALINKESAWGMAFHLTHHDPIPLKTLEKYVQESLSWPQLTLCTEEEILDLSSLERRFFRSIQIYERYFWQEPSFDQSQLRSVLGAELPLSDSVSQDFIDRMVNFVKKKALNKEAEKRKTIVPCAFVNGGAKRHENPAEKIAQRIYKLPGLE